MDPKPNQLSGMQAPVPNQLSTPAPAQAPPDAAQAPVDPQMAVPPPPPPKPRSRLRAFVGSIAGRIVIIGVIILIGVLVRNYTSGNASDLQVGDCFDPPTGVETVKDVQHHPCNEAHRAEVYFVGKYPAPDGAAYPSSDDFDAYFDNSCLSTFKAYTGSDPAEQIVLAGSYYYPASDGWTKHDDRTILCYFYQADGQPATHSYRNANP